jgi:hypothetical protein
MRGEGWGGGGGGGGGGAAAAARGVPRAPPLPLSPLPLRSLLIGGLSLPSSVLGIGVMHAGLKRACAGA